MIQLPYYFHVTPITHQAIQSKNKIKLYFNLSQDYLMYPASFTCQLSLATSQ